MRDYDLYLNLITQGEKLANLNEKLLNYRILANSISRKDDVFTKKLMLEKALYFYQSRKKMGLISMKILKIKKYWKLTISIIKF